METYIIVMWGILFITLFLIMYVGSIRDIFKPKFKDYICTLVPSFLIAFIGSTLTMMVLSCVVFGFMYVYWWIINTTNGYIGEMANTIEY